MEKHLTPGEAWADFWQWIRQPEQAATWSSLTRERKQYLYKAQIDHEAGRLGYERTKNILLKDGGGRYTANEDFTVHE